MAKFYLDLEFTNGNFYLADILELALSSEESGYAFHSDVKIHCSVPKRVQQLTGITNKPIKSLGLPFGEVMAGLTEFLHGEQAQSETILVIIAHGGYSHDFPIPLASCMKHNWDKFGILTECMCVDSMQVLQDDGYKRPGLDALCKELNIKRSSHSELDAYILNNVCTMKAEMMDHPHGYTFGDITYHLNRKLPLLIRKVYSLATECASYRELGCILYEYVKTKSALNFNQVCKVAHYYFRDRYLHCK